MGQIRSAGLCLFFLLFLAPVASAQVQITVNPTLPSLSGDDSKPAAAAQAKDEENTYCRPPLPLTDSRLLGPQVCMSVRKWNELHAQGYDIDPSGKLKPRQGLDDVKTLGH